VSELDQSSLGSLHDAARTRDAELAAFITERVEREGLPRNYRMRADAHYVDQLDRPQAGPVVRLIATRQIDAGELPPASALSSLSESIAAHGILQPLLVRRAGGRYQLIAGRKRLAAAVGGGMNDVPCIIHEVSESDALAIADAERVPTRPAEPVETKPAGTSAVFPALSQDLARIGSLVDVLELASHPFQQRAAADFLKAEAWRATWLVNAAAIIANATSTSRILTVGRALDRVSSGFEPEMRLAKLHLDMTTAPDAVDINCDERFGTIVTGLILATLSWLRGCESPRIEVRVDALSPQSLRLQMVQRLAPAPSHVNAAGQPGDLTETIAFECARAFAASQAGAVEVAPVGQRGALIQLLFTTS
jgi:ParB-like nuclease family protein